MTELERSRQIINETDKELAKLFAKRMAAVKEVAEYKKLHGLQVLDPQREQEVVNRNLNAFQNEELKSYYANFLNSTMEVSKSYQHRLLEGMRVAFSGVKGAFAEVAAKKIFPDAVTVAFADFKEAYNSVVDGICDCAVLPLENSFNGDVGKVLDLAFFGSLYINGIYDIGITQNLLGNDGAVLNSITQVISHPQALGQCSEFIKKYSLEAIEAINTAVASKQVAESGRTDIASIGSLEAASEYGLKIIESHINDSNSNTTRFAVFSRVKKQVSADDKHFVMLFTVNNEAGALGKAISIIGDNGFNLKALKSRPTKELVWSYYFYAEGEGNINSAKGEEMLKELSFKCSELKVLGSFEKEIMLK